MEYQTCKEGGMPHPRTSYCDAGINHPTSNEHKGDVMERREWKVDDYEINDGQRSIVRAPHPNEFPGLTQTQRASVAAASRTNLILIATEHNQHTSLVAQRDLLVSALRFLLKDYEQTYRDLTDGQFEFSGTAIRQAQRALATVEQANESQAGGGSEG